MSYLWRLDEFKKIVNIFSVKSRAHIKTNIFKLCGVLVQFCEKLKIFSAQTKKAFDEKTSTTTMTTLVATELIRETTTVFCGI